MSERAAGILMPISSLPSEYGIGCFSKSAYEFVDWLKGAGQSYWQILPLGPTSYGDSPYQSFSSFAGNPYFIDLDYLCLDGLLKKEECEAYNWGGDETQVDYGILYENRYDLLKKAFARFKADEPEDFKTFCEEEAEWLDNYALFMALKDANHGAAWFTWDRDLKFRKAEALEKVKEDKKEDIAFWKMLQYLFYKQWRELKDYANVRGIKIIGDVPIYVPLDSADVWAHPENFQLGRTRRPRCVAGCPPDGFSKNGQYWGNPIYDWERMEQDGFSWWLQRIGAAGRNYDVVRIDHFRGIESYWSIPAVNKTARNGRWVKGPGLKLVRAIQKAYPDISFIAEDLGFLTPEVLQLVLDSGWPGMKVLEFAFDPREPSNYLPHKYGENCICYTGTHDNETLYQWCGKISPESDAYAREYLGITKEDDLAQAIIEAGAKSKAALFVAQMQDYLRLGKEARMNEPGRLLPSNWRWRMLPGQADAQLAQKILCLTQQAKRV